MKKRRAKGRMVTMRVVAKKLVTMRVVKRKTTTVINLKKYFIILELIKTVLNSLL
jgi:hypothetical protein